jgi:hypothetical protein
MHHTTKKAAVNKYSALYTDGKTAEEIKAAIRADEKGFSPAEVDEIYFAVAGDEEEAPIKKERPHYEEWECKITMVDKKPVYEKLKLRRPRVLISEEQAEILNEGVLHGSNTLAHMYFLPE